jgi:hypothetical protein
MVSYYQNKLYPLQEKVLSLFSSLDLPFYLTGGTALSRHYLNHRYSDDLDLFVNSDPGFKDLIGSIESALKESCFSYKVLTRSPDFVRLQLTGKEEVSLKIDLVNDLVCHIGTYEYSEKLGRIDNIFNILSNKISAIPRLEIKDFADVVFISRTYQFNWRIIIEDALQKDTWVNPIDLARYFSELSTVQFEAIPWCVPVDLDQVIRDCSIVSADMVRGTENTLFKG